MLVVLSHWIYTLILCNQIQLTHIADVWIEQAGGQKNRPQFSCKIIWRRKTHINHIHHGWAPH